MATPRHALITGGTGFIGRRVVDRFLDAGWRVTSSSLPGEKPMQHWGARVALHYGDICGDEGLPQTSIPFDLIVHLAAPVGQSGDYERQWQIIVGGTERVCAFAARHGTRVVVASSIAVYGDRIRRERCSEETAFGAWQGAYGRAKQGQEAIAQRLAQQWSLPLTLIRPANVFGLGGSSAWGDRLLDLIRTTGGAVVGNAEQNNAGLAYVENLADALYLAAVDQRAIGRTYNVCDEFDVSWRRFNNDMAALVGFPAPPAYPLDTLLAMAEDNEAPARLEAPRDPNLPFLEALNLVGFDNRIDATRIRTELGWVPRCSYEDALRNMAEQLATP